MSEPRWVFPDYCHQQALEEFVKQYHIYDENPIPGIGFYERYIDCYDEWIKKEKKMHLGIDMEAGFVPSSTYLYMLDDEVIGCVNIRHCLTDRLLKRGGNIGYSVAPKFRKQGYATKMLQEILAFCKQWEIWPVLVTCDETNIASMKVIEKCGGVFDNKYRNTLRYWIGEEK